MNEDILNSMKDYCIEVVDQIKEDYGEGEKYTDLLAEGYALANDLANLPVFSNISFCGYMELFDYPITMLLNNFLYRKVKELGIA